jgi:hypothetical protein
MQAGQRSDGNLAAAFKRIEKCAFRRDACCSLRIMHSAETLGNISAILSNHDAKRALPYRG